MHRNGMNIQTLDARRLAWRHS